MAQYLGKVRCWRAFSLRQAFSFPPRNTGQFLNSLLDRPARLAYNAAMHEMSIAQSLLDIVQQEMEKHGLTTLTKVTVRHGRLSGIVADSLHMAWEALTVDTPLASSTLVTEEVPLTAKCSRCGVIFEPESEHILLWVCPECGEDIGHELKSGKELHLQTIEAE